MSVIEDIITNCESCGSPFAQPFDPGKRRQYCGSACRQRAYRARGGRASGTRYESASARRRREQEEAFAREEARREQDRQRKQRQRTGGRGQDTSHRPEWCQPGAGAFTDTSRQAKARNRAGLLYDRAEHAGTPAAEASACREAAERIRAQHNLI